MQKTKAFFTPITFDPQQVRIGLSIPVAFQQPEAAIRLGLNPFGYFLSLGVKKYHSSSPNNDFSVRQKPGEWGFGSFLSQVMNNEFFVGWMKSKTWWKLNHLCLWIFLHGKYIVKICSSLCFIFLMYQRLDNIYYNLEKLITTI